MDETKEEALAVRKGKGTYMKLHGPLLEQGQRLFVEEGVCEVFSVVSMSPINGVTYRACVLKTPFDSVIPLTEFIDVTPTMESYIKKNSRPIIAAIC